ncbi:nitric oxide reductase transcriptional regulator NorR [Diaphorobacter sp. HDW4A]|uniref:nitric oxide reductase transcriptional regulator NorR n=1 Tax=Diaphorobacter sp. HDW4A TaxID=2714924 RepID=UPI00140D4B38|nr:nitric oxide reductase transcriptional regulator NorR [Diaphorobacter sp. HDW4A]QIL82188.1 nitric oxide reductase transcriptional regulator NorR [Diaphorobacter sp. HDW4A]
MTISATLHALIPLVADLAQELPERERLRRLLAALRTVLPADAAALLKLEDGEWLRPLAIDGLVPDALGRRFRIAEHPRFAQLMAAGQAMRFAPDSPLPDPYDGLVNAPHASLHVHDCMGCVLQVGGVTWGLLTLDAIEEGRLSDPHSLAVLQAFSNLAAATVTTAERVSQLARTAAHVGAGRSDDTEAFAPRNLVGQSPVMQKLKADIALVAESDLTVLITGETGVGKELVAQAVHARSLRANRPLVSINCAALPESLVESELFGHVRGAFTGALSERRGKFEHAHGSTLFLDEVGELSLPVQAKLLRVLQSGQLQRLGSDREHHVDVRIIAATNRDLANEVQAGRMRADFFHRLSVYPLQVPALRERDSDVLQLAGFFLEENRSRLALGGLRLDVDAQAALLQHDWPGNVRELEHLLSRAVLKALSRASESGNRNAYRARIVTLRRQDLGDGMQQRAVASADAALAAPVQTDEEHAPVTGLRSAVEHYERQLIAQSLARNGSSWAAAARELQVDRANLQRLARRLGVPLQ